METSALSFAHPAWLHALWLLPLGAALFWWAEQRRRALIGKIVAPKLRAVLAGNTSAPRRWFRAACVLGALGLLSITLAGPRLGYDTLEVPHKGRDVIIAMDVSRSMLATDVSPTRLQRAKLLAEDLISELEGDRLGLVAFAGSAFLQAPLTLDHGAVLAAIDELDTDLIPKGGTNLAAAIRTCEEAFGKAEGFSRAIIIISDGEELDADGLTAAKQAAAGGIRIFTVGVGSEEGSEIPLGPGEFVRDPAGKVVQSRLDAARMREIAESTGGFYVPLDDNAARQLASDGISQMQEVEMSASASRRPIERYQWPLAGAIALLALQALVGERRRRPLAWAATLLLVSASGAWSSGLDDYQAGNYEQARQAFEQRLKMEPDSPPLQLNAGTAAYRLKDFGKASEYFSRAMLAEDPALRSAAEFNLGNTLFRQGEGQADKEKKITDWKDAIAKYDAALKTRPDYTEAKENKARVEELLKQAEEEQKKDQKNDQKQDQKKDQQQKQDQQQQGGQQDKQDQQQGGQQKDQKDQQQGGQQEKKDQQSGGQQEKKEDQQQGGQKKDEPSADGGQQQQENQSGQQDKQDQQQGGQKKDEQQQGGEGQKQEQQQGGQQGEQQQEGEKGDEQKDQGQSGQQDQKEGEGQEKKDQQQQGGQGDQQKDEQSGGKQGEQKQDGEGGEKEQDKEGEGREGGQQPQGGGQGEESEPKNEGSSAGARPEPGKAGDKPAPVPQSSGEKKEGELRGSGGAGGEGGEQREAAVAAEAEEEVEGKMSASQARALLRSLQNEEEQVDLSERRTFQDVSRDW